MTDVAAGDERGRDRGDVAHLTVGLAELLLRPPKNEKRDFCCWEAMAVAGGVPDSTATPNTSGLLGRHLSSWVYSQPEGAERDVRDVRDDWIDGSK